MTDIKAKEIAREIMMEIEPNPGSLAWKFTDTRWFSAKVERIASALTSAKEEEREKIAKEVEKLDPLEVSANWDDSDDIAYAVHRSILKIIRNTGEE